MISFKNKNGVLYTKALFLEMSYEDPSSAIYTLKNEDHEHKGTNYLSLYRLYMREADPTEWRVAENYFDGWEHWEQIAKAAWMKPFVESWRKQLNLRLRSEALNRIISESKTNSKDSIAAAKYVLEKKWEEKTGPGRGRPTKEAIRQEAAYLRSQDEDFLAKDLKRFDLN
jgi:hypothetical protein